MFDLLVDKFSIELREENNHTYWVINENWLHTNYRTFRSLYKNYNEIIIYIKRDIYNIGKNIENCLFM